MSAITRPYRRAARTVDTSVVLALLGGASTVVGLVALALCAGGGAMWAAPVLSGLAVLLAVLAVAMPAGSPAAGRDRDTTVPGTIPPR